MEEKTYTPRPRLVLLRKKAGLSQEKAAKAIGPEKHRNTVVKLETGEIGLTDAYMFKLAEAYGCEPWELLEGAPLLSAQGKELLKMLEAFDDERLQTILNVVRQMRA